MFELPESVEGKLEFDDEMLAIFRDGNECVDILKNKSQTLRSWLMLLKAIKAAMMSMEHSFKQLSIVTLTATDDKPFNPHNREFLAHVQTVNKSIKQISTAVDLSKLHMNILFFAKNHGEKLFQAYYAQEGVEKLGLHVSNEDTKSALELASKIVEKAKKDQDKKKEKETKKPKEAGQPQRPLYGDRSGGGHYRGGGGGGGFVRYGGGRGGGGYSHWSHNFASSPQQQYGPYNGHPQQFTPPNFQPWGGAHGSKKF